MLNGGARTVRPFPISVEPAARHVDRSPRDTAGRADYPAKDRRGYTGRQGSTGAGFALGSPGTIGLGTALRLGDRPDVSVHPERRLFVRFFRGARPGWGIALLAHVFDS